LLEDALPHRCRNVANLFLTAGNPRPIWSSIHGLHDLLEVLIDLLTHRFGELFGRHLR
jgi:hypothetical protein